MAYACEEVRRRDTRPKVGDDVVEHQFALMSVERRARVFKHRNVIAEIMPLTQRRQHAVVQGKAGHIEVLNAVRAASAFEWRFGQQDAWERRTRDRPRSSARITPEA